MIFSVVHIQRVTFWVLITGFIKDKIISQELFSFSPSQPKRIIFLFSIIIVITLTSSMAVQEGECVCVQQNYVREVSPLIYYE